MKRIIMVILAVTVALTVAACNTKRPIADVILENRIEQPEVTEPTTPEPKVCPNIYNGTDDTFHIMNDWSDSNYGAHFVEERDDGIYVLATKVEENMWISMHTTCQGDFSQFRYLALQITAQEGTDYFLTAQEGDTNVLEYIFVGTGYRQQVVIDLKQLAKGDYSSMQMLQIFALPGKVGSAQYTLHDFWLSKEAPEKYVGDATLVSDWKDSWSGCYTVEETQEGSKVSYKNPKLWGNIAARIPYPDPQYCQLNMTVEVLGTKKVNAAIKVNYTDLLGNAIQNDAIFSTEIWKPGTNELHLDMSSIFENPEIIPMDLQIFLDSTGNDLTNTENTLLITRTDLSKLTDQATKPKTSNPAGSGAVIPGNGAGPFQTGAGNGYQLKYANGKLTVTMKNVQEWASITYNKPITAKDNKLTITMDNVDDSVTQMQILLMGKSKEAMVGVLTKDMLTGHGEPHTYTFYLDDPLKQLGDDLGKGGTLKFQIESAPAAKEQYDGNGKLILSDPILSYVEPFSNEGLGDWYVEWYRAEDITVSNQGEYLQACSVNRKVSANNWSFIASVPTADAGAGSVFTFEMEHCSGQTGSFLVQIYGEGDSRADVYLEIGKGKTKYTLTIPDTVKGLASQIRIYPENAENAAQLPEQSGIVKLYSASVTDKPETLESLQPVLQSADGAITLAQMTHPGSNFYYKTSLESAVEAKPELNGTDLTDWVLFTEDTVIPSENGITLYVQVIRVEDGKIKGWGESAAVAAGAEFSNTGLQDWYVEWYRAEDITVSNQGEYLQVCSVNRKVSANNWSFIASVPAVDAGAGSVFTFEMEYCSGQTGSFLVQIYGEDDSRADVYLSIGEGRTEYTITIPDTVKGLASQIRIYPENAENAAQLPEQSGIVKLYSASLTDQPDTLETLLPVLQSADGAITLAQMTQPGSSFYYKTSLESAEETKPELNETDLTDWVLFVEDTVIPSENGITLYVQVIRVEDGKIRGWGESTAVAAGAEFSNTGLQDWYVEWYQEQMVTLSNRGEYLSASVADRKAAAANWAFIAAKPAITAGAGSEFTFELAFSPDRTSGDFLIQIHGSSGQCDLFLPISKARDTYSVKVPDSLKGNVAEIRIFTDNPYKSDSLPAAACELKLYGAALTVSAGGQFENTGFGAWYVPSWADQLTLNTTADCLELSYNRAKAGWQGIEAEVTAQNVTAGGVFTFVVDFGAQRGYTDYFIVQFADENGNEYDSYKVFPEMQNGKAEYAVPVPAQLIGSVSKIRILPENGWATNLPSVDVTVKFYKMCISSP